tara:strand:+ start:2581 stop:2799 length:219 start_codon:yes stop_codon:yes gene_type:complete
MTKIIVIEPNKEPVLRDMTADEQSEHDSRIDNTAELEVAKKQADIDLKASAKQKLINGEALTEDEANVMVGL